MSTAPTVNDTAPRLVSLDDAHDPALVGRKAAALARLRNAGFAVPDGVVVPVGASDDAVRRAAPAVWQRLGGGPLAVRSSGVAEDGAHASWAGQFLTVLGVEDEAALAEALVACRRSAHAMTARAYGGADAQPLAILVQRQVPARAAGVAFTADPVTGERDVVIVEAVTGLGERLVSGEATPERWRVRGGTVERLDGPEAVLSDDEVLELAVLARKVEAEAGRPRDIEWAIDGEARTWLLQGRDITALPAAPIPIDEPIPDGIWRRDDHHDVVTPAMFEFFRAFEAGWAQGFQEWGFPLKGQEWRQIRGRMYGRMIADGPDGAPPPPWVMWIVARVVPSLRRCERVARTALEREHDLETLRRWEEEERPAYVARARALRRPVLGTLNDAELVAHLGETERLLDDGLHDHAVGSMAMIITLARFGLDCERRLGWTPQQVFEVLGDRWSASSADARSLAALVDGPLPPCLHEPIGKHTRARLAVEDPPLSARFEAWLEEHGARLVGYDIDSPSHLERPEIALATLRSVADRDLDALARERTARCEALLAEARERIGDEDAVTALMALHQQAARAAAVRDDNGMVTVATPGALVRFARLEIGRRLVARAAIDAPEHCFYLTRDEVRAALRGELPDARAITERRRGEAAWARANPGPDNYGGAEPPMPPLSAFGPGLRRVLEAVQWMERVDKPPATAEGHVTGVAGGGGRHTGIARVVRSAADFGRVEPGDVLVCRVTTPTWTPLFAIVGAVVTEDGGLLSHAAIVAREMNVPAVLDTRVATSAIPDGARVTVDGATGAVTVHA